MFQNINLNSLGSYSFPIGPGSTPACDNNNLFGCLNKNIWIWIWNSILLFDKDLKCNLEFDYENKNNIRYIKNIGLLIFNFFYQ